MPATVFQQDGFTITLECETPQENLLACYVQNGIILLVISDLVEAVINISNNTAFVSGNTLNPNTLYRFEVRKKDGTNIIQEIDTSNCEGAIIDPQMFKEISEEDKNYWISQSEQSTYISPELKEVIDDCFAGNARTYEIDVSFPTSGGIFESSHTVPRFDANGQCIEPIEWEVKFFQKPILGFDTSPWFKRQDIAEAVFTAWDWIAEMMELDIPNFKLKVNRPDLNNGFYERAPRTINGSTPPQVGVNGVGHYFVISTDFPDRGYRGCFAINNVLAYAHKGRKLSPNTWGIEIDDRDILMLESNPLYDGNNMAFNLVLLFIHEICHNFLGIEHSFDERSFMYGSLTPGVKLSEIAPNRLCDQPSIRVIAAKNFGYLDKI